MYPSTGAASQAAPEVVGDTALIMLVDDVRMFRDDRAQVVAQSVDEALDALDRLGDRRIDELWLDYDIVGGTSQPVVDRLVRMAEAGHAADIAQIFVHSSRVPEGLEVTQELARVGYRVQRRHSLIIWRRRTQAGR